MLKKPKKLSIIIVNHNTRELLAKCLDNLMGIYPNMEIIVVDNGSTDGSATLVAKEYKYVRLIEQANIGIARANNSALKKADGDYLLHLGTDAFPTKKAIQSLIHYMEEHPDVGMTTAKLVTRDGTLDMDAHRGFPTPWAALSHFSKLNKLFPKSRIFNRYYLGWKNLEKIHEIDACISHFMLIRKQVYLLVTGWDEDYFVFGEDIDLCYRIKQAGWKIVYVSNVKVLHYKGAGIGRKTSKDVVNVSNSSQETKVRMKKASTDAMKLFYKKHYNKKYPTFVTGTVLLGISLLDFLRTKVKK